MFDNMAGAVGFAMHADRLARAAHNGRLAEAEQGSARVRQTIDELVRVSLARALVTLATRVAPTITVPDAKIPTLAR